MGLMTFCGSITARKAFGQVSALAFASLVVSATNAADPHDKYRLVWIRGTNAGQCPEQSIIEQEVQSRLERDPFEPDADRIVHVFVSSEGGSWHVHLAVQDNTGKAIGQRVLDVDADNCGEVVDAVSLAIALAIDPNVSLRAPHEATSAAALPPRALPPTTQGSPVIANDFPAPNQHPLQTQTSAARNSGLNPRPYQYELTLRAVGASGVLPTFAGGTGVAGSFGRDGARLMLALTYLPESMRDAHFSFGFTAAAGGVCGDLVRLGLVATTVCGEFALGSIHSVVHQLEPLHPGDRLTAGVGLGPKLGWRAWAPLFFEVGVSGWVGVLRPKFEFVNPDSTRTTVFQSRAVSGMGFVGVGVTTP